MLNTVLFDLDGTLLPMDEGAFTKTYFKELCKKLQPMGIEPDVAVKTVWAGTKAMVQNDGQQTNSERFWTRFGELLPCDTRAVCAMCDDFYSKEFNGVKSATHPAPHSANAVRALKQKGYKVVLATNPIFPLVAVETRLSWIGLGVSAFDHITSYETCHFCKPNPAYYRQILARIGKAPGECLMVGNNAVEDMCFETLGGRVFLLTDHLEAADGVDISGYEQGGFAELMALIEALPQV